MKSGLSFLKLMIMIKHKNDANTLSSHMVNASLDKWHIQAIQVTFFRMLKSVLVQTLSQRKITYHPLSVMYCLFPKTDFNARCLAYVAFKCSSTAATTLSLCTSELSPTSDKEAELRTGTFHLALISKQNIASNKNEGREV